MNQQETEQLVKELFSNEEYVRSLVALDTPEEVQASLKERGLELTVEEINQIKDILSKTKDGELSDEDLESVSGGSLAVAALTILGVVGVCAAGGAITVGIVDAVRRRW